MAEIERYEHQPDGAWRVANGDWVKYSDYEKLEEKAEIAYGAALEKVEAERDSLRSQVEAEVKRLRSEDYRLRHVQIALPPAQFHGSEANRLQAILDSTSTEGAGR